MKLILDRPLTPIDGKKKQYETQSDETPIEQPLSFSRRIAGYVLAFLALITCPCHLPIWALLLSGTAVGGLFTEYSGTFFSALLVLFLISLWGAIYVLKKDSA
jgi:mercuric ion transport protein